MIRYTLVIAPKRVAESTWTTEAAKWDHLSGLRVEKIMGSTKQRMKALRADADVYVINRENIYWLIDQLNGRWPFDLVIIDELSGFKSPSSKRWRALRKVIGMSSYVIGLTGSPAPNSYLDLWAEIYLLDKGAALGRTLTAYREKYFNPGRRNAQIIYEWNLKPGAKEQIDERLKPLCLSMAKEDWLDLPPVTYNRVMTYMSRDERVVYDRMIKDRVLPILDGKISELDSMDTAVVGATAAVLSNKLLQMANGAVYDEDGGIVRVHEQKIEALGELVEASGDNLLVFYIYKHDCSRIMEKFPEARKLEGEQDIADWNAGKIRMLLCHPASAGYGLNLQQGGHTVVWFGLPWSLELHSQANARLYRQGQEHPVIVHYILCSETLDEKVMAVLEKKDAAQRGLLDALKDYVEEKR